jgi:hypothetical protein
MRIGLTSPRTMQPNQILLCAPISVSPVTVAFGAIQASSAIVGRMPQYDISRGDSACIESALGTLVAPVAGTAIGGAVGGMLGCLVGGFGGGAVGEALGSDWEETMQSGDNRAAVEASAIKALQEAAQVAVRDFFESVKSAAVKPVRRRAKRLVRGLEQFSEILETKVHSNGRSVPASV